MTAKTNPNVMQWHEAMKQPDEQEFLKVAEVEVNAHTEN